MAFKISDFSPVAHFAINEHLILTQWNSALEHLTGMPANHVLNTNRHQEVFPLSGSLSLADAIIKSTSTDELEAVLRTTGAHPCPVLPDAWIVDNYECQLKGVHRHLQLMAMPIRDDKGNKRGAVQAVLDITNTKNAEEQLIRSNQNFVALAENIGDGFLLNQDEVFILVNQSFATLLGYSHPEEIIGRGVEELIAPTHRADFSEKHKRLLNGVHIEKNRWPHLTKDNRIVWLEGRPKRIVWDGRPAVLSTLVDVTEAYVREQQIQQETDRLRLENIMLRSSLKCNHKFHNLIGRSPAMLRVYELILKASRNNANVILYGESGTGKELAARAIHDLSANFRKRFVPINCGAIPAELLESEFFGAKRGAFTGAYADKLGYLDMAREGTLFLDEVGELPLNLQVKLLRVIDKGTYSPVGSSEEREASFRIIAATNRDLVAGVSAGLFREDFFYRLHVLAIHMPPLRERKEDIPLLLEELSITLNAASQPPVFPPEVLNALYEYQWPGNVREFINTIQRYLTLGTLELIHGRKPVGRSGSAIPLDTEASTAQDIEDGSQAQSSFSVIADTTTKQASVAKTCLPTLTLQQAIKNFECEMLSNALAAAGGNRIKASKILGISRRQLYRKIDKCAK